MNPPEGAESDAAAAAAHLKYRTLPKRVPREALVEEQPAEPPHDPDGGRDPERDFMIRYSG